MTDAVGPVAEFLQRLIDRFDCFGAVKLRRFLFAVAFNQVILAEIIGDADL